MKRLRNGVAVVVAAGLLLVVGATIRPLFIDDPAPPEILSATEIGLMALLLAQLEASPPG
ncbi:hypothetical protein [Nocardia sp. NBC_01329]|uniref:hypothetical protein n=1 Tax=Nocardia sp. NBC_01329 TaxID=2903594 RepID=UPI002E158786|nr:hypothetical protein OG405_04985 [Nocardia sp. NBC_01329]